MCFGLSDLVLINQKGELSKHIQDLFSISLYAMDYFKQLKGLLPTIFFILRDQVDRLMKNQEDAFDALEIELITISKEKKIKQVFQMDKNCFFLLPSAFENDLPSKLFGEEILKLRENIWSHAVNLKNKGKKLIDFYIQACTLWEIFNRLGYKLLSCENIREYETKLNLEEKIKILAKCKLERLSNDLRA